MPCWKQRPVFSQVNISWLPEKERSSYTRGISISPDRVPILLNLGHNLLEQRELSAALGQYNKVLTIAPRQQAALYNKGLIYHLLQDFQNEMTAWKTYLQFYKNGKNSFRAVERLNNLNDFTYRTYQLGGRKIILSQAALLDMRSTEEMNNELRKLTDAMGKDPSLSIDIVLFYENDVLEAQKSAVLLKKNRNG